MRAISLPDLYDQMFRDFDRFNNTLLDSRSEVFYGDMIYPPMNLWVKRDTKDLVLEFAIAGVSEENIKIDVEGDYLLLEVDKTTEDLANGEYSLVKKGIRTSKVKNRMYIPSAKYQLDNIKASLKSGVLLVKVPVREDSKPKKVHIELLDSKKKLEEKTN